MNEKEIKLKPFTDEDIILFSNWYHKDHIVKWLGGIELKNDWMNEIKGRNDDYDFIKHFIVMFNDIKIGYCHYYDCYDVKDNSVHTNIDKKKYFYGIGYLIGEEAYLRKGIGKIILNKLEEKIIAIGGKEIRADPMADNIISIKTLLANGFIKIKDDEYKKIIE